MSYLAFCDRLQVNPFCPVYQDACSYIEYIASHAPAPSTVRNKVSQVRVFLYLSDADASAFNHPRTVCALDALDRDKTHIPNVKQPIDPLVLSAVMVDVGISPPPSEQL